MVSDGATHRSGFDRAKISDTCMSQSIRFLLMFLTNAQNYRLDINTVKQWLSNDAATT